MSHNLTRLFNTKALDGYRAALRTQDTQGMEAILYHQGENLFWCPCGASCLEKKNETLHHDDDCQYENPSIVPHLIMSIMDLDIKSLQLIRERTTKGSEKKRFSLSVRQWCEVLKVVADMKRKELVDMFGFEWLLGFPLVGKVEISMYADYVHAVLEKAVYTTEGDEGYLKRHCVVDRRFTILKSLLPLYKNYQVWLMLMPEINKSHLGRVFLAPEFLNNIELSSCREIMVKDYGVLWNVQGHKFNTPGVQTIIKSLIDYILEKQISRLTQEHRRWFESLRLYQDYLEDKVKKVIERMMKDPETVNLDHKRLMLAKFVPVKSSEYKFSEKLQAQYGNCFNCFRPTKKGSEQEVGLLDMDSREETSYVF